MTRDDNLRRLLFLWNAMVATLGGLQLLILAIDMRSTFKSLYAAVGGRNHNFLHEGIDQEVCFMKHFMV